MLSSSVGAEFKRGISLSGHESGDLFPGDPGHSYRWPRLSLYDELRPLGFNALRLPIRIEQIWRWENPEWENKTYFCPISTCTLVQDEINQLADRIVEVTNRGETIVLDLREQGIVYSRKFGEDISKEHLGIFWVTLLEALNIRNNENVVIGLANEPQMNNSVWVDVANDAIAKIRDAGFHQQIAIQGGYWSGAWSWQQGTAEDTSDSDNETLMRKIVDPQDNLIFEVHQYLDEDKSGTGRTCNSTSIDEAVAGMRLFTNWLRATGHVGMLGETGIPNTALCRDAFSRIISITEENKDVWEGWYLWARGPFLEGPDTNSENPYELYIDLAAHDRGEITQMTALSEFLNAEENTGGGANCLRQELIRQTEDHVFYNPGTCQRNYIGDQSCLNALLNAGVPIRPGEWANDLEILAPITSEDCPVPDGMDDSLEKSRNECTVVELIVQNDRDWWYNAGDCTRQYIGMGECRSRLTRAGLQIRHGQWNDDLSRLTPRSGECPSVNLGSTIPGIVIVQPTGTSFYDPGDYSRSWITTSCRDALVEIGVPAITDASWENDLLPRSPADVSCPVDE